MAKKETLERGAKQAQMMEILNNVGVTDVDAVKELFKELVGTVLSNGLEGELESELGYSKYDYRNKETDNSRNDHRLVVEDFSFRRGKIQNGSFDLFCEVERGYTVGRADGTNKLLINKCPI